jgi:glycyl-tRNA synthetase beta chain
MIILLSEKYNKNILEACAVKNPLADLSDYVSRVEIIKDLRSDLLLENANRVVRIIKDMSAAKVDEKYFVEPCEKALYEAIQNIKMLNDYKGYLQQLETINPVVTKFFDDVLVMDKDENVKNNRISLLNLLKEKYEYIADFSKL